MLYRKSVENNFYKTEKEDFFMEKKTVSMHKKMAEKLKNIEIQGDIIVPDTKPDIVNIIGTNSNPYIYKEECQEGKYRFDGNVDTHIIYLSESGETKVISTTLDFMDFVEDSKITTDMSTKYRMEVSNIETKILNERKISVTIHLKICFNFFVCRDIEYLDNLQNLAGVEKLQETVDLNTVVATNTVKTSLKEDVSIEDDDISDILKCDINVDHFENKISYNKVLSKADANIKIMYITESGSLKFAQSTIPIMNFIDMEKVTDEDVCNTTYKVRNMNFKANSKEQKSISCQIDFEVSCEVYKKQTIELVQDMYGIEKNITFSQKSVEVQVEGGASHEMVEINENILVEDIRTLYDVDCMANITNKTQAGSFTNYEGEVCVDIYFDTGNKLSVKKAKIPFMVKLDCDTDDIEMNFVRKHFKLTGEDVACDLQLEVKPNSSNYKTIRLIDNVEEEECEEESDYAMVVYFVKEGDTIWNIARDFRVSMDSLIKNNQLEENQGVRPGEKLYIMK